MRSLARLLLLMAFAVALNGCLMPPCQLGLGIAITNADARRRAPQPSLQFRAGFHPLQLVKSEMARKFDVGAGVVVDTTPRERTMTSLYAEGLGVAQQAPLGRGALGRLEAGGQARLTWDRTRGVITPGIEPIMKAEAVSFASGKVGDTTTMFSGGAHGEAGAGVYFGGYWGGSIWAVSSGLFFRVPAMGYSVTME
jgi:hypothetical protein